MNFKIWRDIFLWTFEKLLMFHIISLEQDVKQYETTEHTLKLKIGSITY